ncbi:MAG: archease [Planctomycetes bacterium]|nr:archease [Planctomycetota bacterium]
MQPGFELFDHTADIGIRIVAPTMEGLIAPATDGLYAVIGEIAECGPEETVILDFAAEDTATLLRDYLAELLRLFETSQRVIVEPQVTEFSTSRLRITARALRIDADHCIFHREVKAITYHELEINPVAGGFEATVIVDI